MDYLWTPWRYAYVSGTEKTTECVFCEAPKEKDDRKALIVYRGEHCFVILNAYPYTPGHVMIVPYTHLDELRKLPAGAAQEMMALSQKMESVLRELYRPDGINLGDEYRQSCRRRNRRAYSHARAAPLGRGRKFYVRCRRNAGAAGDAGRDMAEDEGSDGRRNVLLFELDAWRTDRRSISDESRLVGCSRSSLLSGIVERHMS